MACLWLAGVKREASLAGLAQRCLIPRIQSGFLLRRSNDDDPILGNSCLKSVGSCWPA